MFCSKCGKEVNENQRYCPHCGNLLEVKGAQKDFSETLDSFSEDAGKVIDETIGSLSSVANSAFKEASKEIKEAVEDIKNPEDNLRDLGIGDGTDDNVKGKIDEVDIIEKYLPYLILAAGAIGFTLLIPFVLNFFANAMYGSNLHVFALSMFSFKKLFSIVISLGALVTCAGMVYLYLRRPKDDQVIPLIAAITSFIVFVGGVLYAKGDSNAFTFLFTLIAAVLGIDLFLNVYTEKKELHGVFNIQDDIALFKEMFIKSEEVDINQYTDKNIPQYEQTEAIEDVESYFDGTGGQLFINFLLVIIITMFTCGLGTPWGIVHILRWTTSHTVIEGRRQRFNGTATQLFGLWIKWWILTILTCGIYAFFAFVDYKKWEKRHTSYVDALDNGTSPYPLSNFDGNTAEYIGYAIISYLINLCTCCIALPWAETLVKKWETKSTVIERERYFYDGTGGGLFGTYIIVFILNVVTCGLYTPWGICRMNRYIIKHTHVDALRTPNQ